MFRKMKLHIYVYMYVYILNIHELQKLCRISMRIFPFTNCNFLFKCAASLPFSTVSFSVVPLFFKTAILKGQMPKACAHDYCLTRQSALGPLLFSFSP